MLNITDPHFELYLIFEMSEGEIAAVDKDRSSFENQQCFEMPKCISMS